MTKSLLFAFSLPVLVFSQGLSHFSDPRELFVPNEILVQWKHGSVTEGEKRLGSSLGSFHRLNHRKDISRGKIHQTLTVEDAVRQAMSDPAVEWAQPNYRYYAHACAAPTSLTDPYYTAVTLVRACGTSLVNPNWPFLQINAPQAWAALTFTCPAAAAVTVAILDTGVASDSSVTRHPDLPSSLFVAGFNTFDSSSNTIDDYGHGTWVAGIIAGQWNNSGGANACISGTVPAGNFNGGMAGVAGYPGLVKLMPVKVLDNTGTGNTQNIIDGTAYAVANGAKILNFSLGSTAPDTLEQQAIQAAIAAGCVVIASAGNESNTPPSTRHRLDFPAGYPGVISVGATTAPQTVAWYSNGRTSSLGVSLSLVAPGGSAEASLDSANDIYASMLNCPSPGTASANGFNIDPCDNNYGSAAGTSAAAPVVTGAAAVIWSVNPSLFNSDIFNILTKTATDLGPAGWDSAYGNGLLNLSKAVSAAVTYIPTPPTATLSPTPTIFLTSTPTRTSTKTPTLSPTNTPTRTPTSTSSPTASNSPSKSPTPTSTRTASLTPSSTPSYSPTVTPTKTSTATPTESSTNTPSSTGTDSPTATATLTPSKTPTSTPSSTPTDSPSETPTVTPTPSATHTPTNSPSPTGTNSPTASATSTPTQTPSVTPTITPTNSPSLTPTFSPTPTPTDTLTPTETNTDTPSNTPTNSPTLTPTQSPTATPTESLTPSPTSTPTDTLTAAPSATPTNSSTASPTDSPSNTPSSSPTLTATSTPSATPSSSPTSSATSSPSSTPTNSSTETPTETPSLSPTSTFTPSDSPTHSPTNTPTETPTLTYTNTAADSPTGTLSPTQTPTPSLTYTITLSATFTPTITLSPSLTPNSSLLTTFSISYPYPNPNFGSPVHWDIQSPGSWTVELSIFTPAVGRKIRQENLTMSGSQTISWDLKDETGQLVANGIYFARVKAFDGSQTITKIFKVIVAN